MFVITENIMKRPVYSDGKNNQRHVHRNCLLFSPQDMVFVGLSLILIREKQIRILCKKWHTSHAIPIHVI